MLLEHRTDFWESQHSGLFSLYHEAVEGQGLKCECLTFLKDILNLLNGIWEDRVHNIKNIM